LSYLPVELRRLSFVYVCVMYFVYFVHVFGTKLVMSSGKKGRIFV
jgi:hypothetical protein